MTFKKAERTQATLKIALTGPSGSGKTFSGLILAAALGKKIAVVDSENKSASLYADSDKKELAGVVFDVLDIEPPYTIAKYTEAIEAAEKAGYDVLLVDSISHAWQGEGGLLDKKAALDARGVGNSYTNWATITPEQERFKARILQAGIHVICTMRSKQDYVLEQNDKGKSVPRKVGLAPIQRDGMEYEFTTVFDIAMDHQAAVSKDRTGLFDGQIFKISAATGVKLMKWLKAAKPQAPKPAPAAAAMKEPNPTPAAAASPTEDFPDPDKEVEDEFTADPNAKLKQLQAFAVAKADLAVLGVHEALLWTGIHRYTAKEYKVAHTDLGDFTPSQIDGIIEYMRAWKKQVVAKKAGAAAAKGNANVQA